MLDECKKTTSNAVMLLMLFQTGCASSENQNVPTRPPVSQANYCSEYLCLALQPLFKEDDFVTPEITKVEISNSKTEYSLDYNNYGLISLEVFHENQSLPCNNSEAFVRIDTQKRIAYDVNCVAENNPDSKLLKITYFPKSLNEVDEFKFLSLVSHVWLGRGNENDTDGKSSLSLKFSP